MAATAGQSSRWAANGDVTGKVVVEAALRAFCGVRSERVDEERARRSDLESSCDKVPRAVALHEERRDSRAGTCMMGSVGATEEFGVPQGSPRSHPRIRRGDDGQPDRWD